MSININVFKEQMDMTYEEIFQKSLIGKMIANMRFEKDLKEGATLRRAIVFIDGIRVRDIVQHTNRPIDKTGDSSELITINRNKGTHFRLTKKEEVQAGGLNPGSYVGAKVARKTAQFVDGDILVETRNALTTFDNGDLTTLVSTGTSVAFTSANVSKIATRVQAKLSRVLGGMEAMVNTAWVLDSYAVAELTDYLMSKNTDYSKAIYSNGLVSDLKLGGAEVYLSENLSADLRMTMTTNPSNNDTVTINGYTFRFVTTIGTTAGNVLIGASVDATRTNLANAINSYQLDTPATTATHVVFADDANNDVYTQSNFSELRLSAVNEGASTNVVSIVGTGSGRLIVGTTGTAPGTVSANVVNFYYGKKGAIDVVSQYESNNTVKEDPYQSAKLISSEILYGVKLFKDGAKKIVCIKATA